MKRRNGFTLTEILIALVLVGVLSAVVINTMRSRDMSEEFTAKRDKAIMNIQGVIKNTMFNERIEQLASFDDIKDKVNEHLSARADGDNLFMRDGTMYSINTVSDSSSPYVAELTIDTNGNTLPNSFGLDKYKYKLDLGGNLILDENTDNSNWSGINPPGDIPGGEIPNGGGADPKLPAINNDENKCPSGTHWDGSKCTPDEEVPNNECGANEQWNGVKCVPIANDENDKDKNDNISNDNPKDDNENEDKNDNLPNDTPKDEEDKEDKEENTNCEDGICASYNALYEAYLFLSDVYEKAVSANGTPDTWGLTNVSDYRTANDFKGSTALFNAMKPYLDISKDCGGGTGCFSANYNHNFNYKYEVEKDNLDSYTHRYKVIANGMSMAFHTYNENCNYSEGSVNDICGKIFIDIDGPDNGGATFAQDRFEFNVTANGIMPAGLGENPNRNNCFARGQHCEAYMLEHCKTKK